MPGGVGGERSDKLTAPIPIEGVLRRVERPAGGEPACFGPIAGGDRAGREVGLVNTSQVAHQSGHREPGPAPAGTTLSLIHI